MRSLRIEKYAEWFAGIYISHEPNGQSEFPKSADEGRRGTREEEEGGGREMSRRDEQEKE